MYPGRRCGLYRTRATAELQVECGGNGRSVRGQRGGVARFHQPYSTFARFRQVCDAELPG